MVFGDGLFCKFLEEEQVNRVERSESHFVQIESAGLLWFQNLAVSSCHPHSRSVNSFLQLRFADYVWQSVDTWA